MVFELFFYCVTVQTKNILKHKSALVMGICFQTLCPQKRGFLYETGFSLPHRYPFDSWSIERASITITSNRGKCGYLQTSKLISNELGFWRREPRLVTYATEISLLRSLVASQQLRDYGLRQDKVCFVLMQRQHLLQYYVTTAYVKTRFALF